MVAPQHIGPHEYSFDKGIFCFAPRGVVAPEHASQLVVLLRQHGRHSQTLLCLFDLTASVTPTAEARRVIVEFLSSSNPQMLIATYGGQLQLRAMMALVTAAARVLGGYYLQVRHFKEREQALHHLRQAERGGSA